MWRIDSREIISALYVPLHHAEIRRLRLTDRQHRPVHDPFTEETVDCPWLFREDIISSLPLIILKSEDYALLIGSIGLFTILSLKKPWIVPGCSVRFNTYDEL